LVILGTMAGPPWVSQNTLAMSSSLSRIMTAIRFRVAVSGAPASTSIAIISLTSEADRNCRSALTASSSAPVCRSTTSAPTVALCSTARTAATTGAGSVRTWLVAWAVAGMVGGGVLGSVVIVEVTVAGEADTGRAAHPARPTSRLRATHIGMARMPRIRGPQHRKLIARYGNFPQVAGLRAAPAGGCPRAAPRASSVGIAQTPRSLRSLATCPVALTL
jgi:hypothetical protein